jgi:hypothetical protein
LREKQEGRGEMLPKPKNEVWKPPRCYEQLVPLEYVAVLQKQQAKACWKCCQNTKKVTEIFCVYTENFQQTNMIDKRYF